jgi:hypothetical protein
VAKKILTDERWLADPHTVTAEMAAKGHLAVYNLPITTVLGIIGADVGSVAEYTRLFVADNIAATTACVYSMALGAIMQTNKLNANELITNIVKSLSQQCLCESDLAETMLEFSRKKLSDLELGKTPIHAINSLKIICYTLRIISHAHESHLRPDVMKTLEFITSAGGDASSNCAIAMSMLCAATYASGDIIVEVETLMLQVKDNRWITTLIDNLTGTIKATRTDTAKPVAKPAARTVAKSVAKPAARTVAKSTAKSPTKSAAKPAAKLPAHLVARAENTEMELAP